MSDYGLTFHVRGRMNDEVTDDDAFDVASLGIFYAQTLFTLLTLISAETLEREAVNRSDFDVEFKNAGRLGVMLLSASYGYLEQIENARQRATEASAEILVDDSSPDGRGV
jgi:hypothetical protein